MSRLVLHIGTHKTATTSIQRFLSTNRAALAGRGVWYPDYSLIGLTPHYAHLGMANALSGRHDEHGPETARAFFAAVRERAGDHNVTVLSAEPFYRHVAYPPDGKMPKGPEAYWPARARYVERIRDLVGEAQVAIVFRRQDDYVGSLYQEHVKVTRYRWGFKTFLSEFWYHFAFLEQVRAWEAAFGAPRALGFERLRAGGAAGGDPGTDLIGAFCAALGIDAGGLPRPPRQNEGLLPDLVVLKRILHAGPGHKEEIRARIEGLAALVGPQDRAALARRSLFDGPGKRAEFLAGFARGNAALAAYAPDLADGAPFFPAGAAETDVAYGDKLHPRFLDLLSRRALAAGAQSGPESEAGSEAESEVGAKPGAQSEPESEAGADGGTGRAAPRLGRDGT